MPSTMPLTRPAVMALAWLLVACARPVAEPEPVRAVRTMVVAEGEAGERLEFAAEVKARVESKLGFRVGGKMLSRPVELGDAVRTGQVLARLDPRDLRLGEDGARAALASAEASHALAQADFRRYRELLDQGFISAAELERRETTLKAAEATLRQARATAAVQGNQAGYAALVAGAAGVVTAVEAEPGQVLEAGQTVLRLAHDGPRDAVFSVPENRLDWLRSIEGRPGALQVRLWGAAESLAATVREVAAATDPVTRTVLVKADLGSAPVTLGRTATVQADTPRRGGAIKLPLAALAASGGRSVVWVLDAATMQVQPQPVEVGGAEGNEAVIVAGLSAGQEVVTAGVHVLAPGQTVKRYVEPAAPTASR